MASSLKPGDLFEIKIVKLKNAGDFRAKSLDKEGQTKVHIRPEEHKEKMGMLERAAEGSSNIPEAPSVHDILIFKWNNRAWARGRVEKVQKKDKLIMRDLDTGEPAVNVLITNTRHLPPNLQPPLWPPDILLCTLAKVKPISFKVVDGQISDKKLDATTWDQAATDEVSRLVNTMLITCQVVALRPSGLIEVMMWTQSQKSDKPKCVNELLVTKTFARVVVEEEGAAVPALVAREAPSQQPLPQDIERLRVRGFEPLIIGEDPLHPINKTEELRPRFYTQIEKQYLQGRGEVELAPIQRYGWPVIMDGRDGIFVFTDRSKAPELTFIMPILSKVASGTYSSLPKNFSPKVVIIVPSCKECDDIYRYCQDHLHGAMKFAMSVRTAYSYSKSAPHPELWNNQDILITTPHSLLAAWADHKTDDGLVYFSNTCHIVLHNAHDLFTHHVEPMTQLLPVIKQELDARETPLRCQISVFSHIWLPVFASISMKYLSRPLLLFQYRTEAALYAGVKTIVQEYSSRTVLQEAFIKMARQQCDQKKRVIVFTSTEEMSTFLITVLQSQAIACHLLDSSGKGITPWTVGGSCLVTTDTMAQQFVIKSADIVLHFTMPGTLTNFSNRLCCMENLYSGYNTAKSCFSCFFLCEEQNTHVYQVATYLKRYSCEIPQSLLTKAKQGELEKESSKKGQVLCNYFRQYGSCTYRGCPERHIILPCDKPGSGLKSLDLPTSGKIQVKVTAVADGNRFYVQLLSVENGICVNTQQRFADMQAKLNQDSSEAPRYQDASKLEVGTIVLVRDPNGIDTQYYRAEVLRKFYNADLKGTKDEARVRYLDTGFEAQYDLGKIYQLPHRLANKPPAAVEVIVCGVRPSENDRVFSSHCKKVLQQLVGQVMEGNIELALGNTLWVKTLESRVLLKALKLRSSSLSVKKLLIDNEFGIFNPQHIVLLRERLREAIPQSSEQSLDTTTPHVLSTLDLTKQHTVCISHVNSPSDLYVQLSHSIQRLEDLVDEINQNEMLEGLGSCWLAPGSYCLAKYGKDAAWYRGRVIHTWHDKYHILFVDYGNKERAVPSNNVKPIPVELLSKLPLQAIPCLLSDVLPLASDWSSSAASILTNLTMDGDLIMSITSSQDPERLSVTLSTDDNELVGDMLGMRGCAIHLAIQDSPVYGPLKQLYNIESDTDLLHPAITAHCTSSTVTRAELQAVCRVIKLRGDDSGVELIQAVSIVLVKQEELQDVILSEGLLPPLIALLSSSLSSPIHCAVAQLIATAGSNPEVKSLLLELTAIPALCGLCKFNEKLTDKLEQVLKAIRVLCQGSKDMCKELKTGGHIRTLVKFVEESHGALLKEVLETAYVICSTYPPAASCFKDERGLKEVCRAVRRTNSPFLLHLLMLYEDKESMSIMVSEGLSEWLKRHKIKGTRDFTVKMLCGKVSGRIAEYRQSLPTIEHEAEAMHVPQVMRAPIYSIGDMPGLIKGLNKVAVEDRVHPKVLWYQRKRKIGMSIQVKDIGVHTLELKGQQLTFSTYNAGIHYACSLALYAGVTNIRSTVGQSELVVLLDKQPETAWKSLLSSGKDARIKLDFSRAVDSEDETASEGEEYIPKAVPRDPNTVICIGGSEEEEELLSENENCDDMGYWRNVGMAYPNSDSDHMEGLE